MEGIEFPLGVALVVYVVFMFALSWFARTKIDTAEDYIVAGRRLPFSLATATLFATWFGAGTLMATSDEVRANGLANTLLEPYGPGICLILAGILYARPLWEAKILTLYDYYRARFGRTAEIIGSLYAISFFGWIATQFVGAAGIIETFYDDLDRRTAILLVAGVAGGYTLVGGMWSVTLTDAVQLILLVFGLALLGWNVFAHFGDGSPVSGVAEILTQTPNETLVIFPAEKMEQLWSSLGLLLSGTIGLIPSQDLLQRVFSSRSSRVAQGACIFSGTLYLVLGSMPVLFGLAARLLWGPDSIADGDSTFVIPRLAKTFLTPLGQAVTITFILCVLSTILSTIDSAILAPSSVLAQNLLHPLSRGRLSVLGMTQVNVVIVTIISVALALSGERLFSLLEGSYSLPIPSLVVLTFALYQRRPHPLPAACVLSFGLIAWIAEQVGTYFGYDIQDFVPLPLPVWTTAGSIVLYVLLDRLVKLGRPNEPMIEGP
ncbi:MAG TPA: sodium:solute symporter family protein [Planctomycetota bacterium]|nr:sodium:solute symporter family protein [Planctomycetota bacterium]